MKTLTVVLTLLVSLLAGTFSAPAMHAMPMTDTVGVVSSEGSGMHDCCDEVEQPSMAEHCDEEGLFCQYCEQHCAGQIGLVNLLTEFNSPSFFTVFKHQQMALWQRSERLIRPPKRVVA
ncbi:hypothetical protein DEU29_1083 [Idiomarina aquatica]|uniref:Uncharacterized protein n=1 Tax=Idiomarina aquatica TaxID=1327752 RepID=A0A4R6P949_9GAMM|nr:hypothetical protein [Idiomarina aquatica]TDP32659.1 hypothetical protein DEU29_1083 [Idiomarina aquatica]